MIFRSLKSAWPCFEYFAWLSQIINFRLILDETVLQVRQEGLYHGCWILTVSFESPLTVFLLLRWHFLGPEWLLSMSTSKTILCSFKFSPNPWTWSHLQGLRAIFHSFWDVYPWVCGVLSLLFATGHTDAFWISGLRGVLIYGLRSYWSVKQTNIYSWSYA